MVVVHRPRARPDTVSMRAEAVVAAASERAARALHQGRANTNCDGGGRLAVADSALAVGDNRLTVGGAPAAAAEPVDSCRPPPRSNAPSPRPRRAQTAPDGRAPGTGTRNSARH